MIRDWSLELSEISAEAHVLLGGWLAALERISGALAVSHRAVRLGSPLGLAGVSRRGPPERLLESEWLLAAELPELFVQRAADRLQLHTALDRETPTPQRELVAILETGPDQAGVLRLVQVALLLSLALTTRAAVRWGRLDGPGVLHRLDPQEPASVDAVLRAISPDRGADPRAWLPHLTEVEPVWLGVGARGLPGLIVQITESFLAAEITVQAGATRVVLSRPDPASAARLLCLGVGAPQLTEVQVGLPTGKRRLVWTWTLQRHTTRHPRGAGVRVAATGLPEALPPRHTAVIRRAPGEAGQVLWLGERGGWHCRLLAHPHRLERRCTRRGYPVSECSWALAGGLLPLRAVIPLPPPRGEPSRLLLHDRHGLLWLLRPGNALELVDHTGEAPLTWLFGAWVGWILPGNDRLIRRDEHLRALAPLVPPVGSQRCLARSSAPLPLAFKGPRGWIATSSQQDLQHPLLLPEHHELLAVGGATAAAARPLTRAPDGGLWLGAHRLALPPLHRVVHHVRLARLAGLTEEGELLLVDWDERSPPRQSVLTVHSLGPGDPDASP